MQMGWYFWHYIIRGKVMNHLTVDVIIPAYKPDGRLTYLVEMLQKQTYPIDHILIINTEERFWNPDLITDMDRVEIFHIPKNEFDHGGTRRLGESFSGADILVYMTQDAIPADRQLIRQLIRPFQRSNVKASYARQLPTEDCRIIESYTRAFNYPETSCIKSAEDLPEMGIKTFFCSNVCAAYDHKVYKELGGFPKHAIFNEDMIYAGHLIQAGYSIAYQAEAQVIHSHNYSGWQQFTRNFDLAVSQVQNPDVFSDIKSESEGIRLVKTTAKYLKSIGKGSLIFQLIYMSGCKYLGYRLGRLYRRLPYFLVKFCSMNKSYWELMENREIN